MKWEKCTFGELKAGEWYAIVEPTPYMVELHCRATDPANDDKSELVYRLIPDAPDAKWVEKAAEEIERKVGTVITHGLSELEKHTGLCASFEMKGATTDIAAIIRRHAPAIPALDVSAIESKLEAIKDRPGFRFQKQLEYFRANVERKKNRKGAIV